MRRLAVLLLLAGCPSSDDSNPPSFSPLDKSQPNFLYAAGGAGFDADDNLVLVGQNETIRWKRSAKTFERFGGPLQIASGAVQRDAAGDLFIAEAEELFVLRAGTDAWTKIPVPPDEPSPIAGNTREWRSREYVFGKDGTIYATMEYIDGAGVSGIAIRKRGLDDTAWTTLVAYPQMSNGYFTGSPRGTFALLAIKVRADGTIFVETDKTPLVLAPGATELVELFDCSTVVGKYCDTANVFTNALSDKTYVAGYALPSGTTFPVVPTAFTGLTNAPTSFSVAKDGTLYASYVEEDAVSVDYPPYVLDVTTMSKLSGSSLQEVAQFVTPSFSWIRSDHDTLYSYGIQYVGGTVQGWGVYSLSY